MNENNSINGPVVINLTVDRKELAQFAEAVLKLALKLTRVSEEVKPAAGTDSPSVPQMPEQFPVQGVLGQTASSPVPGNVPAQTPAMMPTAAAAPAVPTPQMPQQLPVQGVPVQTMPYPVPGTMPAQTPIVPTTAVAQEYSYDQLAVAAAGLVNQGKQPRLFEILHSFGVNAMTELPREQYGAFASAIKAEGAVI